MAAGLVGLTLWLRLLLDHYSNKRPLLILFFLPILLSAYFGGRGPGWFATGLVVFAAAFFLFPPVTSLLSSRPLDLFQLLVTAFIGALLTWLIETSRRSARRLDEAERLRQANEGNARLQAVFDTALDGVIVMDHDGSIREFNPAAEGIFGWRRAEVLGRPLAEVIIPAGLREQHRSSLARHLATGATALIGRRAELPGLRADGTIVTVELSVSRMPGEGPPTFAGFVRDVTERRRAQDALRESEERFRTMADGAPALIWLSGPDGERNWFNRQWLDFVALSRQEHWTQCVHVDDRERCLATHAQALEARVPFQIEYRLRRHDAAWRWVLEHGTPRLGANREFVGFIGSCMDVTDSKQALEALRESQAYLQTLVESLPQLVWTSRPDGPCDYLSPQWVAYTGRSAEEQLGYGWAEQIHPDDRERARATWAQATSAGERLDAEFRIRRADGAYRWFKTRAVPFRDAAGQVVKWFGSNTDFDDLQRAQQHQTDLRAALERANQDLRQSQLAVMQQERLQALGQMASGIAHDINNAISPAALYAEALIEKEPGLSHRGRRQLEVIQNALDDIGQTVARMREFYRQREPQVLQLPVVLDRVVKQVAALTRARWLDMPQQQGVVIRLAMASEPDMPAAMGVESELREALVNLVFNAVDAMPEGGTLTFSTRRCSPDALGVPSAAAVCVEVSDTGSGMDEPTRARCLEPFFTTKGDRGTGLGLAMVYGVVQRHGGCIQINSVPGRGTTVRLCLPAAEASLALAPPPGPAGRVGLKLLVVDDEPLVLESMHDLLTASGYVVTAVAQGQAGIDAFLAAQLRGEPFDIVITDLGMPHVDGRRVAGAIKAASPGTPVLLLTGWGQGTLAEGEAPAHVDRVLSKPPKLRELRQTIEEFCPGVAPPAPPTETPPA